MFTNAYLLRAKIHILATFKSHIKKLKTETKTDLTISLAKTYYYTINKTILGK